MAEKTNTQASTTGNQVVGKVFIIYGTVKAISPDGVVRTLAANSPIFAYDRIVTESDGSIAIMLDGTPPTQLDIGRMSDITIDEDVFAGVTPETATESTADVEQIQQALLSGDQPLDLEATASGTAAGGGAGGGGHPIVSFDVTGNEVNPGSGADTEGITSETTDTFGGVVFTPEIPENLDPEVAVTSHLVYESGLATGSDPAANSEAASGAFRVYDPDGLGNILRVMGEAPNGSEFQMFDDGDTSGDDVADDGEFTATFDVPQEVCSDTVPPPCVTPGPQRFKVQAFDRSGNESNVFETDVEVQ